MINGPRVIFEDGNIITSANKVVERQDKVVVETQEPKGSSLKSGEKLLIGDGPIILYRRIREELKKKTIEKKYRKIGIAEEVI